METRSPIQTSLEEDEASARAAEAPRGNIGQLLRRYEASGRNLLGYVLDMSYDEATIVTCDAWKRNCGGVPKNSFVLIRTNPSALDLSPQQQPRPSLILARVTEAAGTPLSDEVQQTIFAIHKVQAVLDPYTNADLQWSALKSTILGTYYDARGSVEFGSDIDSYISPHFYEVYAPSNRDLEFLINAFVMTTILHLTSSPTLSRLVDGSPGTYQYHADTSTLLLAGTMSQQDRDTLRLAYRDHPEAVRSISAAYRRSQIAPIGTLRYTETQTMDPIIEASQDGRAGDHAPVRVNVTPADFIANRTALFGKTRMGKSNTVKVIADMILRSPEDVGQVIFDLAGEYAYRNEQDRTSLYDLHRERCVRYSLNPRPAGEDGGAPPRPLRINFFSEVELGHTIIRSLWATHHSSRPGYLQPFFDWEPSDENEVEERFPDRGDRTRYLRARSMYFAVLYRAGFDVPQNQSEIELHVRAPIRQRLSGERSLTGVRMAGGRSPEVAERQPVAMAARIYEVMYRLYQENSDDRDLFPDSDRTGDPYFDQIHLAFLRMLGDPQITGPRYLTPFNTFHDVHGSRIDRDIVNLVSQSRTVIIDLSNADEVVAGHFSELVATAVFRAQVDRFTRGTLGEHSVLFYFEEAHNLFRQDDKDLTSIYNRLAKEGAKFRVGLVYLTQSMTTLSPDLLKNTENFFIGHLNDDREIRELTRRYEFRDVGLDVQRCKTQGYVRLITLSHRYALPVQIIRFGQEVG